MDNAILIVNAGSSSLKFAVYGVSERGDDLARIYHGQIEPIGPQAHFRVQDAHEAQLISLSQSLSVSDHEAAFLVILNWLEQQAAQLQFIAAGHRIVHGGAAFDQPVIINKAVITRLETLVPLAPLHLPPNLAAVKALTRLRPDWVQVACFDTTFHRSMPEVEQTFALPRNLTDEGIRRYGFHGLSYEYLAGVLPQYLGDQASGRVVLAHLGHGASMCALKNLSSVATTMTFTPLDGLPMATRCGTLDPAVVLYLLREKGMDVEDVSNLLHHRSGLLGLSGISGDMRELLSSGDPAAQQAIDVFVHRVTRELGSLAAVLGGLDALVFTAGIGEHAPVIRERICQQSAWLGIQFDAQSNTKPENKIKACCISTTDSAVSVWVIPTNEERMIARHTWALLSEQAALLETV
jgi:acetate kinase